MAFTVQVLGVKDYKEKCEWGMDERDFWVH
jgi:hypothetical protein